LWTAWADTEVQFVSSTATVKQGDGRIYLPVLLKNTGGNDETIQLSYSVTNGSAKEGVNYRAGNPAITNVDVPSGANVMARVSLFIMMAHSKNDKYFTVTLDAAGNPKPQVLSPSQVVVTIKRLPALFFVVEDRLKNARQHLRTAARLSDPDQRKALLERYRHIIARLKRTLVRLSTSS